MRRFLRFVCAAAALAIVLWLNTLAPAATELLDFCGAGCLPCQQMAPVVDGIERDGYTVRRIDCGRQHDLASRHGVTSIPCFVLVQDGREIDRVVGKTTRRRLLAKWPTKKAAATKRRAENQSDTTALQSAYRSTVRVRTNDRDGSNSLGSGVAVRWGRRWAILTAAHVVRDARAVWVRGHSKRWHRVRVVRRDRTWDLAVLITDDASDFSPVTLAFGEQWPPESDATLFACGFGRTDRFAVRRGRLRRWRCPTVRAGLPADWMVIGGSVRSGDSGGPVFDRRGQLVGIIWGAVDDETYATQCGRLHLFLRDSLGNPQSPKERVARLVPVPPVSRSTESVRLCGLMDRFRGPQKPQAGGQQRCTLPMCRQRNQQPAPAPQINVQADPRVGDALLGINSKLDTVVANTSPEEPEQDTSGPLPALVVVCVVGALIAGVVLYYVVGQN